MENILCLCRRQYCKDVNTPKSNPQIQRNPYQNHNDCFGRNEKADPKIHMEFQGTPDSQNNLEKEKQTWKTHIPNLKTYHKATVIKTT